MLHAFQLSQRASAVKWLHRPAGHRKALGVSLPIGSDHIVGTHRVLDAVGLDVPGRRQDRRRRYTVGLHNPYTIVVVPVLPARFFLQASSRQGTEMMMNIEELHGVSLKNDSV